MMPTIKKVLVFEDEHHDRMVTEEVHLFPQNVAHINCLILSSAHERAEWEFGCRARLTLIEGAS
jgi:hypothetical protein